MTNYPHTTDTNLNWKELRQLEIFGRDPTKQLGTLLKLEYHQYYGCDNPKVVGFVNRKLDLKITDYGLSRNKDMDTMKETMLMTGCGSVLWMGECLPLTR